MTTASIVKHEPSAIVRGDFSREQLDTIKRTVAFGTSDAEFAFFIEVCKRTGLDPFRKQIYAVMRGGKMTIQTGIDGFRSIAERSGKYDGQEGPFWCGEDGIWHDCWLSAKPPAAAKVAIFRKGWSKPIWAVARFGSYKQENLWNKMPEVMIAKVAEALGIRKAFPEDCSGIYAPEEMDQAVEPDPPPQRPASTPPPALHEGGLGSAIWSGFQAEITQAVDAQELAAIGQRIKAKQTQMTLTQLGTLRDLVKERRKEFKAPKTVAEVMGDNQLPESWGGPPEVDAVEERCVVCEKALGASPAVQVENADGEVGFRHQGCHQREPGED